MHCKLYKHLAVCSVISSMRQVCIIETIQIHAQEAAGMHVLILVLPARCKVLQLYAGLPRNSDGILKDFNLRLHICVFVYI